LAQNSSRNALAERVLAVALIIAVVDCVYLSWRFFALHGAPSPWVIAHTGICSWTAGIDCDRVLVTPDARAFYVPNATLGLGFFAGAAYWWFVGARRFASHRRMIAAMLLFWLAVASLITLRFWALLVRLPALCPFCPWNHVFTYIALVACALVWRAAPRRRESDAESPTPWRALGLHAALSIAPLVLCNGLWAILVAGGVLDAGSTLVRW
jgi:uncharacterized membrane protein